MAHAGTPTDLAKQPATSTTNGLWQALIAVIVLVALVATMVFIGTNVASRGSAVPAADHRIEAQRGPTTAAAALILVADDSYDRVEKTRAGAFSAADDSYMQIEKKRAGTLTGGSLVNAPDADPGRQDWPYTGQ